MNPTQKSTIELDEDTEEFIIKTVYKKSDSHAEYYIKTLIRDRKLAAEMKDKMEFRDDTNYRNLYFHMLKLIHQKQAPSARLIFSFRPLVTPLMWYYNHSEPLPEPTPFTAKHFIYTDEVRAMDSLGILRLKKLRDEMSGQTIEQKYGLYKGACANILCKTKLPSGLRAYRSRPTFELTTSLKDLIKPDLWYIYPDETQE